MNQHYILLCTIFGFMLGNADASAGQYQQTAQSTAPSKIMIIRHAEKIDLPHEIFQNMTIEEGGSFDNMLPLSIKGNERAHTLAVAFTQNDFLKELDQAQREGIETILKNATGGDFKQNVSKMFNLNPLFETPNVIVAAGPIRTGDKAASNYYMRAIQTVQPLAKKLGLKIVDKFHRQNNSKDLALYKPLVQDLMQSYPKKTILVSWPHHEIFAIAKLLNAPDEVVETLAKWANSSYDQVWSFNFNDDGELEYVDYFPQQLLQGDSTLSPRRFSVEKDSKKQKAA